MAIDTRAHESSNALSVMPDEEFRALLDDAIDDLDFADHRGFLTRSTAQRTLSMLHMIKREEGENSDLSRAVAIAHAAIGLLSSSPDRWKNFAHRLAEALDEAGLGDVLDGIYSPFPDLSAGQWYDRRVEKREIAASNRLAAEQQLS